MYLTFSYPAPAIHHMNQSAAPASITPPDEAPPLGTNPYKPEPYVDPPELSAVAADGDTLSEVEAVVAAEILDGATCAAAGRAAGLSAPGAGVEVFKRLAVRSALCEALEARGIGNGRLASVIDDGLSADMGVRVFKDGSVDPGGPDHAIRLKYLRTVLELRGDLDSRAPGEGEGETWEVLVARVRGSRGVGV